MKPVTLEYALHLWPKWINSIHEARNKLTYIPGQSIDNQKKWRQNNNIKVWSIARDIMNKLRLPQCLRFYWICCFYADYEKSDGSYNFDLIYDVITGLDGMKKKRKIYPWLEPEVWYPSEAHQEFKKISPAYENAMPFKIEGSFQLLDWQSLLEGIRQISSVRTILLKRDPHPLTDYVNKAKKQTKLKDSERNNAIIGRFRKGTANFDDLLTEEWQSPIIQAELGKLKRDLGVQFKYSGAESKLKKQVYNRIRSLLVRAGLQPNKPKTKWWQTKN